MKSLRMNSVSVSRWANVLATIMGGSLFYANAAQGQVGVIYAPSGRWGSFGSEIDVNEDGRIIVAANRQSAKSLSDGAVYDADLVLGSVSGSIYSPDPQPLGRFGGAISLAPGGQLLVGEPGHDRGGKSDVGAAYLFAEDGRLISTLEPPADYAFEYANFGIDVELLGPFAAVVQQYGLHIYNASSGDLLRTIDVDPAGTHYSLYWPLGSAGGDLLASTAGNGVVRLNPATGEAVGSYEAKSDWCPRCNWAIASNSDTIAVARNTSADPPEVVLFDATTAEIRSILPIHEPSPSHISLDLSADYLAIATYFDELGSSVPQADRGLVEVYSLPDLRLLRSYRSPYPNYYNDWFGSDIALFGDQLLVSARWDDVSGIEDAGAVYVFKLTPEPSSLALAVASGAALFAGRRRFVSRPRIRAMLSIVLLGVGPSTGLSAAEVFFVKVVPTARPLLVTNTSPADLFVNFETRFKEIEQIEYVGHFVDDLLDYGEAFSVCVASECTGAINYPEIQGPLAMMSVRGLFYGSDIPAFLDGKESVGVGADPHFGLNSASYYLDRLEVHIVGNPVPEPQALPLAAVAALCLIGPLWRARTRVGGGPRSERCPAA